MSENIMVEVLKDYYLKISAVVRLSAAIIIIYLVYKETGPMTATFAFLMFVYTEMSGVLHKLHIITNKNLAKAIKYLVELEIKK